MAKQLTPDDLAKSNTEHAHQQAFFAWLLVNNRAVWECTFAVPNGGKRDVITGGNLKAEGVKSGVPDIFCAWPTNRAGLFIEMKKPIDRTGRKGTTQGEQEPWHDRLRQRGYEVTIAYTWREAAGAVLAYFGVPHESRPALIEAWAPPGFAPIAGPGL